MRPGAVAAGLAVTALVAATPASAGPRSLRRAQLYSGAGTGVSAALFLSAFLVSERDGDIHRPLLFAGLGSAVITPSLGNWYVDDWLTPGMGIRVAASLIATLAITRYTHDVRCPGQAFDTSCQGLDGEAIMLLGVAAIAFVGGAAYDIKELPDNVAGYNARRGYQVTPILVPASPGPSPRAPGLGLGVAGTF